MEDVIQVQDQFYILATASKATERTAVLQHADIFEVRGTHRERRGIRLDTAVGDRDIRLGYRGLDHEDRWAVIEWSQPPQAMTADRVRFDCDLQPHAPFSLSVAIRCERQHRPV